MNGLDQAIAGLAGGGIVTAIVVAFLLGLRHATDPDHLTAVTTLMVSEGRAGTHRAGTLGLFWGLGHAVTLFVLGLPLVLVGSSLPDGVQRAAEISIGLVIAALAGRLMLRWRRGYFHTHPHRHGSAWHSHPHVHEHESSTSHSATHSHPHPESLGRTPRFSFGIGMLHGIGGSGAFGALLVGAASGRTAGVLTLLVFALGTAVSMAAISSLFGNALSRGPALRRFATVIPVLATASLVFALFYVIAAL